MTRLVKIGLFVLLTGTGSVIYVMQTAETIDAPDTYQVKAMIENASGLNPGTRVWVSGVTVGRVREVELVRGQAQLLMEISSEVPVYRDAVVKKTMQSMLGNAVVTLQPGTPQKPKIESGGVIYNVVSSTAMDRTFQTAEEVGQQLNEFMTELNNFMGEGGAYQTMDEMLNLARDTVDTTNRLVERNLVLLAQSMENVARITERLDSSSNQDVQELSKILAHTASIAERLDVMLANRDDDINSSIATISESVDKLNASLADLNKVTQRIERGEGNLGKFINDESIYERVDRVTQNVDEFVNSAMGLEVQVGVKSEYMALQNAAKTHAEVRLLPKGKPKYYSFGVVNTPDQLSRTTETRTIVIDNTTGTVDSDTTTTETERTNELKLSAQMARSFGPLTLRGGIIESSAGFGLNYQPIRQISLSTEMFEFGQENAPYLRGYGTLFPVFDPESDNPLNWLYITGGVDNALHNADRDYFIGLGLRLTDNDLRTVLPFAPSP
jgi:phospholipid/cholesterol/gamma-HCH transport system substrate-binding protein